MTYYYLYALPIVLLAYLMILRHNNVNRFRKKIKEGRSAYFYVGEERMYGTVVWVSHHNVSLYYNGITYLRSIDSIYP